MAAPAPAPPFSPAASAARAPLPSLPPKAQSAGCAGGERGVTWMTCGVLWVIQWELEWRDALVVRPPEHSKSRQAGQV